MTIAVILQSFLSRLFSPPKDFSGLLNEKNLLDVLFYVTEQNS